MKSNKKALFLILFIAIGLFTATKSYAAESEARYLIKSDKSFWKKSFGVRQEFKGAFTANLSDFQLRLAKIFGVEVEPVRLLQILPATIDISKKEEIQAKKPSPTPIRFTPSDQTPWGIEVIYNDPLILSTSGGDDVKVAVLDTGVFADHPDLKGAITQCKDFSNARTPVVDGKCLDRNGHGTHVAGIIAANGGLDNKGIYGVAPKSHLFAYKVCNDRGSCYSDDIAAGIRTASDQGANIINLSLGTDVDVPLIHDAIIYASSKGTLVVAAAGNDGSFDDSIDYPAAYKEVIAVGAINNAIKVTEWSSRGINERTTPYFVEDHDIEFAAPGENIESTAYDGSYIFLSGTSMASPFVAGLAAKLWQSNNISPADSTRELLHQLSVDLPPTGDDNASGFGLTQLH